MDNRSTLVWFAKSFGLFYLIALSVGVVVYAYWPSNKKRFDQAAQAILDDEDKPTWTAMAVEERDPHTGYLTTGHEWNGIKELNTPVPRPVYFFLIVTALFSVGYWMLMPAWPLGTTYTKGLLGIDQRTTVTESLKQAALDARLDRADRGRELRADPGRPALMEIVRQTGRTLFGDNCAACHGATHRAARASRTSRRRLAVGRRSRSHRRDHPRRHQLGASETRVSQMLAFGRDRSSSATRSRTSSPMCSACPIRRRERCARGENRGRQGRLRRELRRLPRRGRQGQSRGRRARPDRPILDLRRRRRVDLHDVWGGLQGQMPSWEGRLSPLERKILALYLSIFAGANDERDRRSNEADPNKALLWVAIAPGCCWCWRQRASPLRRRHVAAGLRRACAPGRGRREGRRFSAADVCTPR